ncbi:unnamed protein product [Brassica napus]|uniref:(rape) hypothetical protein n=1 Tax=Brassica napus TaxID=3708 RepID=A0A816JF01_BRANA|nr:unnamed protein product [Brassica napus]
MPPFLFEDCRISGGFVHIWKEGIQSVNEIKFKSLSTPTALRGHPDSVSAWFPNPIVLSFYYKFKQQGDMALSAIGFEVTRSRLRSQLDEIHTPTACEIVSSSPTITSTLAFSLSPASLSTPTKSS